MRTPSNLPYHELTGLPVKAVDLKSNTTLASGRVIWETKNTLIILSGKGRRLTIPKRNKKFVFRLGNMEVEVDGNSIALRPEERTGRMDP